MLSSIAASPSSTARPSSVDKSVDNPQKTWTQDNDVELLADQPDGERLQKFLARAGVASRRHAEELIALGVVAVNGVIVTEPGSRVGPDAIVTVRGREVRPVATTTTIAIYKPTGYISTASDPQGRPIVADILPKELRALRLVPVGRLDADSEGLLLLSNDGDLALQLTHPRYEAEKEYHALIAGSLSDDAIAQLRRGVVLAGPDARPTAPARVERLAEVAPLGQSWITITLHEGRKRQIRLMCAAVGARVERLIRVRIGRLRLGEVTPNPGGWRRLGEAEIARARENDHV